MARIIDKDEKRANIALSAIKLFCEKGIQQTSIDEIAKSAEVAKGTIYLYFKNKEEIVFTIWDILSAQHQETFQKNITVNMSAKEKNKSTLISEDVLPITSKKRTLGGLGFANIWMAIFGDVGVLIIAVLNAMRTLSFK